jgi:LruC domain-containing protein
VKNKYILLFLVLGFFSFCEKEKKQVLPLTSSLENKKDAKVVVVTANPNSSQNQGGTVSDIEPTVQVSTTPGYTPPFTFDNTNTIPVIVTVSYSNGSPVPNCVVVIKDPAQNNSTVFQQVTNTSGGATGSIILPNTSTSVHITVTVGAFTSQVAVIPLTVQVTDNGVVANVSVTAIGNITLPILPPTDPIPPMVDSDGDGVEDSKDAYPNDPTKTTKIRFPATGVNTIAFEDLYPNAGDADLNDYVIQFYNEEDLNAKGEIVEVRGAYQHVARGAGYSHKLKLLFPTSLNINYETSVTDANGVLKTSQTSFVPTSTQLNAGLEILGNSSTTISSQNSNLGQTYEPGFVSKIKIKFNAPVARSVIGNAPYNIYMNVISTGHDVFFPNRYFNPDGTDKFLDANGFPWAIMVPGVWAWPLESQDIRNSSVTGYPRFQSWASSKGINDKDWYLTVTSGKVFPIPSTFSPLLAFINQMDHKNTAMISLILLITGISVSYLIRKRIFA